MAGIPVTLSPSPVLKRSALSSQELARYGRHLSLSEIGVAGQERLKAARVLIVGAGGLGSPAALYLASAGIGTIGLVDDDVVDRSNLQRQILYGEHDVGRSKLDAAHTRLRECNPNVALELHEKRLTPANAREIIAEYDVVVDGTDNFATRYLVNDVCVLLGRPNVYGSVLRFEGQASVFATADGPCYRCLFRDPPPAGLVPSCGEAGVMGVLPGIIGTIQATETIKLITGAGESLAGRLLLVDALTMSFRTIHLRRDPDCPACGTRELGIASNYVTQCEGPAAGGPRESAESAPREVTPRELQEMITRGEALQLVDVREPHEWEIARLPAARLVPLHRLDTDLDTLERSRPLVVYCHHGARSRAAAALLEEAGFTQVSSLAGGIARWSADVDPSVPTY